MKVYILNWIDLNGRKHQEEFVTNYHYNDMSRSWVHNWNNPKEGLMKFTSHCPMKGAKMYEMESNTLKILRSKYIIIPEEELKPYEIQKV